MFHTTRHTHRETRGTFGYSRESAWGQNTAPGQGPYPDNYTIGYVLRSLPQSTMAVQTRARLLVQPPLRHI